MIPGSQCFAFSERQWEFPPFLPLAPRTLRASLTAELLAKHHVPALCEAWGPGHYERDTEPHIAVLHSEAGARRGGPTHRDSEGVSDAGGTVRGRGGGQHHRNTRLRLRRTGVRAHQEGDSRGGGQRDLATVSLGKGDNQCVSHQGAGTVTHSLSQGGMAKHSERQIRNEEEGLWDPDPLQLCF